MAAADVTRDDRSEAGSSGVVRRWATESKAAVKTTEFYAYMVVLVGILIAGLATETGGGHDDRFIADDVWLYATILTVGFMASRGLAKSGSRQPFDETDR